MERTPTALVHLLVFPAGRAGRQLNGQLVLKILGLLLYGRNAVCCRNGAISVNGNRKVKTVRVIATGFREDDLEQYLYRSVIVWALKWQQEQNK